MEDKNQYISGLIFKHIDKTINEDESQKLNAWINSSDNHKKLFNKINSTKNFESYYHLNSKIKREEAWNVINSKMKNNTPIRFTKWIKYAAVFILPLVISLAVFHRRNTKDISSITENQVIHAGTQKAQLVLANGNRIDLVNNNSSNIYTDSAVQISNNSALLEYKPNNNNKIKEIKYNEIIIPRGAEYQIRLSDGTHVMLNSKSKLRFPEVFNKNKREVYLEGEAFFNVAHNKECPFYVVTDDVKVKVYGTRFNINTHRRNVVQTTLVDGKVSLSSRLGGKEYFLKPEQLGEFNRNEKNVTISDVDVDIYTGWTNSRFIFEDERLEDILETLSLWYDVDVFYQNQQAKDIRFTGYMKRYSDINMILASMEETISVKFKINKRCITVIK